MGIGPYWCLCLQQKLIALSGAMFPLPPPTQDVHLQKGWFPLQESLWRLMEWHRGGRGQRPLILIGSHAGRPLRGWTGGVESESRRDICEL